MSAGRSSLRDHARDFAARLAEGETLDELGIEHGVTRERIRQVVAEAGYTDWVKEQRADRKREAEAAEREKAAYRRATRRYKVRSIHPGAEIPTYTDDDLVAAVRVWMEDGGSGVAADYEAHQRRNPETPSTALIANRIGWAKALTLAGYEPSRRHTRQRSDYMSKAQCLDAVVEFLSDPDEVNGGHDSYDRWQRRQGGRDAGYPSGATVRHRFGTWSAAKREALTVLGRRVE